MATSNVSHLTRPDLERLVDAGDGPVLVDFWADWCQPCHMLSPTIEGLADAYGDRATIAKVDVDANKDLATEHGISSIPTVLVFDGGEVMERIVGVQPREAYATALDGRLS
jgi:thioredoxin 1